MKQSTFAIAALVLVLTGAAGIALDTPQTGGAATGHQFREAPLNAMGVKSLEELRGKPVVIDFWGRN